MTKTEILQLGEMARIRLSDAEAEKLNTDIESILGYVRTINNIVADNQLVKKVGARYNIFRKDEITNEPGEHTKVIQKEMPKMHGEYLQVKKILNTD